MIHILYVALFWTALCSAQQTLYGASVLIPDEFFYPSSPSPTIIAAVTVSTFGVNETLETFVRFTCGASYSVCEQYGSPEPTYYFVASNKSTYYPIQWTEGGILCGPTNTGPDPDNSGTALCTRTTYISSATIGSISTFDVSTSLLTQHSAYQFIFTSLEKDLISGFDATVLNSPTMPSTTTQATTVTAAASEPATQAKQASSTVPSPTSTSSSPPASSSSNGNDSDATKIGAGVGVGVGVPLLVLAGLGLYYYRQRRPRPSAVRPRTVVEHVTKSSTSKPRTEVEHVIDQR